MPHSFLNSNSKRKIFIFYYVYSIGLQIGYFYLTNRILAAGATYPEALPGIRIVTIILANIITVFFLLSIRDTLVIKLRYIFLLIPILVIFWALIHVVVFLLISFFVMVGVETQS